MFQTIVYSIRPLGIILLLTIALETVNAQSLTQTLAAEDPAKLAQEALEKGDIIRGAILYHQGNINCAKCHRASAEQDRFGPDLSTLGVAGTNEHIVQSIIDPSREIKEGFETLIASDVEGRVFQGLLVSENDREIVIRDKSNIDQLIRIPVDNLVESRVGTKSSMPDNLVDQLKSRAQFLDLVRYVIDIRERGNTSARSADNSRQRRTLPADLQGRMLINEYQCTACHEVNVTTGALQPKSAPRLTWSASKLNPRQLARFIANPHGQNPSTTMPKILGHLPDDQKSLVADEIVHYLVSVTGNEYQPPQILGDQARRGEALYHSIGCVACHSTRDDQGDQSRFSEQISLDDIADKYSLDAMVEFLEDPHAVRPGGRMPRVPLQHSEVVDLAHFLLSPVSQTEETAFVVRADMAAKGKTRFRQFNCVACHDLPDEAVTSSVNRYPIKRFREDVGCLGEVSSTSPVFAFSQAEKQAIRAALASSDDTLSTEQQIELTLATFQCSACHSRGDFGGVSEDRNPHFQTTNLNLGDQGRIPPALTGVGGKLHKKWLRDVLVNGRVIRPYMKTAMPQYGEENIGHLVDLFVEADAVPSSQFAEFDDQKKMREFGLELAGNQGLNCVACHTYQYKLSDTMPAVDLTEMAERMHKEWFFEYMLDPQHFSPNTVMPSFWPDGNAIRKDLEGDARYQIEALWQYLIDGRQARAPRGVVREPMEIVVGEEARMLRRNFQGIGKRGIAVGYPGGVNLAFDAEQLRLAAVWKGKFIDPAGAWSGQGSGTVRVLGKEFRFAKGPDLDYATTPWEVDDGRPPRHQFLGYELDSQRRPEFQYRFGNVDVTDFFEESGMDAGDALTLTRRVQLTASEDVADLRFRIASGTSIVAEPENQYLIDDQILVQLDSHAQAVIQQQGDGNILVVPIQLQTREPLEMTVRYSWK